MASRSMKDVQAAIDDAIDQDEAGGPNWERGQASIQGQQAGATREDPDSRYDADSGASDQGEYNGKPHDFGYDNDGVRTMSNPQVGNSPVSAVMMHIQRGNATPEEMMMLHQAMSSYNPPQSDGAEFLDHVRRTSGENAYPMDNAAAMAAFQRTQDMIKRAGGSSYDKPNGRDED